MSTIDTSGIPDIPRTLAEKVWDDHLVVKGENGEPDLIYIDLHLVHEVTSPQAFDGLRAEGRPVRRLDLTIATEDHNTPTLEHRQADRRPHEPHADRDAAPQRRRVRRAPALPRRQGAGHRARRRPAARPHDAGHHRGVRRQPHLHPRRVRRDGVRHRHQRGRARAGHADAAAEAVQDDGHHGRGRAHARRDRERHHPGGHRQDRHQRRTGLRARVPRLRDPRALDGGADDDLQHVDRSRRARRHGGTRRDDVRVPRRSPARAEGSGLG